MAKSNAQITDNYRKMANRAIFSIVLFVVTYFTLVFLALVLTIISVYLGVLLIRIVPTVPSLFVGGGICLFGIVIFAYLIKFIFSRQKIDRSHLKLITAEEHPALFSLVRETSDRLGTKFPKGIYLSAEVNASVFYDTTILSMFWPVRKNLHIGLGLVNASTISELQGVIAHEFGHFSQPNSRVLSYVYNANHIIQNLFIEDDSFTKWSQKLANSLSIFAFFMKLAFKIIQGIKWILKKMYTSINLSYMALSREMEFHADAVAASVTGSEPIVNSLLRMNLAEHSYIQVLNYYNKRITSFVQTQNFYTQQKKVMNFLAEESNVAFQNDLPLIKLYQFAKYNKSKIKIEDRWSSHPVAEDRVKALLQNHVDMSHYNGSSAFDLFNQNENVQRQFTADLFAKVEYTSAPNFITDDEFFSGFKNEYFEVSFDKAFNSFYDNKQPGKVEYSALAKNTSFHQIQGLYNDESVELVYQVVGLEQDIFTLNAIQKGESDVPFFNYDGIRYEKEDCGSILDGLNRSLNEMKEEVSKLDQIIYDYFLDASEKQNKRNEFESGYIKFIDFDAKCQPKFEISKQMAEAVQFTYVVNNFSVIESGMNNLKQLEIEFKRQIQSAIEDSNYQKEITSEMSENWKKYLSKDWVYFNRPDYYGDHLGILTKAMEDFHFVIYYSFMRAKRNLLALFLDIEKAKQEKNAE